MIFLSAFSLFYLKYGFYSDNTFFWCYVPLGLKKGNIFNKYLLNYVFQTVFQALNSCNILWQPVVYKTVLEKMKIMLHILSFFVKYAYVYVCIYIFIYINYFRTFGEIPKSIKKKIKFSHSLCTQNCWDCLFFQF